MFYNLGEHKQDYVFVYDSDDESCELVLKRNLRSSKIKLGSVNINPMNLYKFRTFFGFERSQIDGLYLRDLCSFSVKMKCENNSFRTMIHFSIFLIPENLMMPRFRKMYIGVDGYAVVFNIESGFLNIAKDKNKYLHFIDVYGTIRFRGFILPLNTAVYILRLVDARDINGVIKAFDGLVCNKLVCYFDNYAFQDYYYDDGVGIFNILWSDEVNS